MRIRRAAAGLALVGAASMGVVLATTPTDRAPVETAHAVHGAHLAHGARAAAAAHGTYELTSHDGSGKPVRWLACKPIEYRINTAGMPAGMTPVVQKVMRTVQQQTGAKFRYAGKTDHGFASTAHAKTPTIYVAFTGATHKAGQTFGWPGQIGVGGPMAGWYTRSGSSTYEAVTHGRVLLSTKFRGPRIGGGASWESLILHEVGHALNLDHRGSPKAVMHATLTSQSPRRFTPTEVKALKRVLQTSGCDYKAWSQL